MKKHYVIFYSPGTFLSEESSKEISSWDTVEAVQLSKDIQERYGAKPFGFRFTTCIAHEDIDDGEGGKLKVESREVAKSGIHYLGGSIITIQEVHERNDPSESILLRNMECSRQAVLVENRNSYRHTGFFYEDDCIVNDMGAIIRRGNDEDLMALRLLSADIDKMMDRMADAFVNSIRSDR